MSQANLEIQKKESYTHIPCSAIILEMMFKALQKKCFL